MDFSTIIIIAIIGYIFYRSFLRSGSKSVQTRKKTTKRIPRSKNGSKVTSQSLIRNAQRLVTQGNFDAASDLYLRAGQVFTAAKMKILKGPQFAGEALQLIRINSPQKFDLILDNLVNECYHRINKPALASALLRQAGYHERAEAIEVVSNISTLTKQTQPAISRSRPVPPDQIQESKVSFDLDASTPVSDEELDDFLDHALDEKEITQSSQEMQKIKQLNVSNTLHLAAADLNEKCLVCKKTIRSGDPFIYCLNCGKPGHYRDFGEMMKVSGKCPNCKERLVISMYQIE